MMDFTTLKLFLGQPIDGASLIVFRFLFGLLMGISLFRKRNSQIAYYTAFDFYFKYPFFELVKPCGKVGMNIVIYTLITAYFCLAVGFLYPFCAFVAFFLRTYIFLLDKAQFNNHHYLVCLLLFLFSCVKVDETIPYWHLLIFQLQILIVYTWAGINKIQHDWLVRGQPMKQTLAEIIPRTEWSGHLHRYAFSDSIAIKVQNTLRMKHTGLIFSWFGMLFDLLIIWLMLNPVTLPYALPFYVLFHLFNWWCFQIGIFPQLNLAAIVLFLNPEWSRSFFNMIQGVL